MKNKKGAVGMIFLVIAILAVVGLLAFMVFRPQQVVDEGVTEELVAATKEGDVASIGVYVRDLAATNVNAKVVVGVYCENGEGIFIIDGTASSATAEITGKTTIGKTITCYAYNATLQTLTPAVIVVDEEAEHIVIDAFTVATNAQITLYDDTLTSAGYGAANLSLPVAGAGADAFLKMRFKNNNTDSWIPLGGLYIDTNAVTNVSAIKISGNLGLTGFEANGGATISESDLSTDVGARRALWDFVFEVDDDSAMAGNQPLMIDENDYFETGAVQVETNVGCDTDATAIGTDMTFYGFTKGWYRKSVGEGMGYGHETDADAAAIISTDLVGPVVYCSGV